MSMISHSSTDPGCFKFADCAVLLSSSRIIWLSITVGCNRTRSTHNLQKDVVSGPLVSHTASITSKVVKPLNIMRNSILLVIVILGQHH